MSKYQMPTVEELVKVFKDNNWTPMKGFEGAGYHIAEGKCCAIPALLQLHNELPEGAKGQALYDIVKRIYGEGACLIWHGFDSPNIYNRWTTIPEFIDEEARPWMRLGSALRLALEPDAK